MPTDHLPEDNIMNTDANLPIQLFCVISTLGDFTPVRFRYADEDGLVHSVSISSLIGKSKIRRCGRDMLCYRCHTDWEGQSIPVELRYDITDHKWSLARRLDGGF